MISMQLQKRDGDKTFLLQNGVEIMLKANSEIPETKDAAITTETQIGATCYTVRREFSASAKEDAYHVMKRLVQQAAHQETEPKIKTEYVPEIA